MNYTKHLLGGFLFLFSLVLFSCKDIVDPGPIPTGNMETFNLASVSNPGISGTAQFIENDDNTTNIILALSGAPAGGMYPAHIHFNTAAEGGGIAITLGTVMGGTGTSSIIVSELDDGTPITYSQLMDYDGYINVHASASDLGTIVAQGDIGQNALTGETKIYDLGTVAVPGISGTATFSQRKNDETLVKIMLEGTPDGGMHPSHIHLNTAAEGGPISVSFTPIDGTSGMSVTNVSALDNETSITYDELLEFDGYINVHLSTSEMGTLVAQGDIGQNELTGVEKVYELGEKDVDGISGTATFKERMNGEALAILELMNTPEDGMHPAHIHSNTALQGGGIVVTFKPVNGATGMSKTNVSMLDDETMIGYDDILDFDGYINVHLSMENLATIVAQGDIGQNELTGESKSYVLDEKDVPGINGTVTFRERMNGTTLAILEVENTIPDSSHPAHIHANSAEVGGGIVVTFTPVDGTTGMSMTNVEALDDMTAITYDDLLTYDGYVNVHLSMAQLGVIVAQGNIGSNAD
ncbi:CHRD domain-containing protein [Algoriphagus sp. D3-2-R+10]|uniref:CHRD domain-containing protein n=1 Tax=Algoriphagus aurantiacus TaxID=3103948 RepID=UPI002B411DC9|nr:CHRD domain-containing protein [Algoriphagus sp. D3-2-R+10]